jgi:hypothetical protein
MSQPDILTISSYNSLESESASYFEAVLPSTIVYPKRMILNKFVMPNLMYDIAPNYNNVKMSITYSVTPVTAVINIPLSTSTHWVSAGAFASYLQTTINAGATGAGIPVPALTITFDITTGKLTLTANANISFFLFAWDNPDPITAGSAWYKLGFTKNSGPGYTSPILGSMTGDSPLILFPTAVIYVAISLLGNSLNDKRSPQGNVIGDDTIYGAIPVNANFGQIINYSDSFGSYVSTTVNSIRSIRVTLLNEEYNQIVIPQNCYVTMEFRLEYT